MRHAIGRFFRNCRRQNEQKRRPRRERTPGYDASEKQDDHAAMHMQQTVRGARAHAERGTQRTVKVDHPFHRCALSTEEMNLPDVHRHHDERLGAQFTIRS